MWEINVTDQLVTFVYSLVLGIVLCVIYDMLRAIRKIGFDSVYSVLAGDILFSLVAAFLTYIFLLATTKGEIRGYVLLAEILGFAFSRGTVSRITLPFFKCIFKITISFLRHINFLNIRVFEFLESKLRFIFKKIKKIFKLAVKTIKKLLKSMRDMLYTKPNNGQTNETE